MAGPNDSAAPSAVRVDPGALVSFAGTLRSEAGAVGGLDSGLAAATGALPGTTWDQTCGQAKDSVDKALHRIGDRFTAVADGIEKAGKAFELTDQQFGDTLSRIGLHQ
ncbi:ESX-1 secretion-associated protein [Nocardia terpenica]|uniref:ESX-1 secretion-associated protein n=1 Tax=Nocardia terpenica TaxID=455432 RepID=A0A6G9ZC51_9NOCA|nr:ESX-1 secretion-associated protein [Nocardia terpenica]QIS22971.1 ESX-1 secretion-associated protein [Nocardia terpenica]